MSYSDEEKRAFGVYVICKYFNTCNTLAKLTTAISGITPVKIKAKIKQAYIEAQLESDVVITIAQEKKVNDSEMESEY